MNTIPRNMTSGYVKQDKNHIIQEIHIDNSDRYKPVYANNINEIFESFIGMKLVKE